MSRWRDFRGGDDSEPSARNLLETIVGREVLSAHAPYPNNLRETAVALAKRYQIISPVVPGFRPVRLVNDTDRGTASPAVALQRLASAEYSQQRWSARKSLGFALGVSVLLWAVIVAACITLSGLIA